VRLRATAALVAGFLTGCVMVVMALALFVTVSQQQARCGGGETGAVGESQSALAAIPSQLMPLYQGAASRYALGPSGWAWLGSINAQETDFGRNLQTSSAGAVGWMQFEPGT
jgi:hypothetical protein